MPDDPSRLLTAAFLLMLLADVSTRILLMRRQIRHVGQHRGTVPPAFADTMTLAAHQRAADYTRARMQLAMVDTVSGALLTLALTLGGGLQALHAAWQTWFEAGSASHGVALLASVGVLGGLVDLPLVLYRTFGIEKRFGFNRMTPTLFVADLARQALIATLFGLPLLLAALWLMREAGELWWLWVWALWLGSNLLALLIWPTFIAPLFNTFTPLADAALQARLQALLTRCGFQARGLFVMDGSRRSAHGNAYFTGFGAARRIVLFDTLLARLDPDEIEAVLAHELGHFHHRHLARRILVLAPSALVLLALLGALMQQAWFFVGLGMSGSHHDQASALALFFIALPAFSFMLSPLIHHGSRRQEYEADAYAARHSRASDLIAALVKLYRDNAATLTPDPLYSGFFDTHPPAALRVARLQALAPMETRR